MCVWGGGGGGGGGEGELAIQDEGCGHKVLIMFFGPLIQVETPSLVHRPTFSQCQPCQITCASKSFCNLCNLHCNILPHPLKNIQIPKYRGKFSLL